MHEACGDGTVTGHHTGALRYLVRCVDIVPCLALPESRLRELGIRSIMMCSEQIHKYSLRRRVTEQEEREHPARTCMLCTYA
eukprot:COSAG05_NODE_344_length_11005_cov_35.313772_7_plen_82_part_00